MLTCSPEKGNHLIMPLFHEAQSGRLQGYWDAHPTGAADSPRLTIYQNAMYHMCQHRSPKWNDQP
jgi:hypothetical protein